MSPPPASLSLDLDNLWSYLKIHGDPGWESFPSYLDVVVPRVLAFLAQRGLRITFFVVGQDAARQENGQALAALAAAGHEIGNHSFRHESWLHLYSEAELEEELARAEEAIEQATGRRPAGFRGPGFSLSAATLAVLARRGYRYDASTLPTFLGPLARAYYFRTAGLTEEQRRQRSALFGKLGEGFRPIRPYRWRVGEGGLVEIPVTTMPLFRTPIHLSYVLYLDLLSPALGRLYFDLALRLCRLMGVQPSILLHPLDFLGGDDTDALSFFPGMRRSGAWKMARVSEHLEVLARWFEVVPMGEHAERLVRSGRLREREPVFSL
ncbi:MAG TPA: polysaccharide deacetylase family protein [Thermoanaerobaculia bacterium]|nr:polysaccharide deacetylase family protein [Thermoanaerobaculia bacterium]